ncbi:MAG: DUF565 domain-containing protein [Cyanobacteria bacterium P01_G01_bin.19]
MQRTRLNTLVEATGDRLELLFSNPWRRTSLSLISILLGFFMGSALVTTAGQAAIWDMPVAALVFAFTELISRFVYGRQTRRSDNSKVIKRSSLYIDVLNLFKVGLIYSLFLEAFKLGS